jgi:16S rRNA (uracil1498-N3)-methyltransferase
MKVRRVYVPDLPEGGGMVTLGEAPSRHVRVLRLCPGDEVMLFDGAGRIADARIRSIGDRVVCESQRPIASEPRRARLVLMLAIPKGPKLDDCVRMATELGVDEIALMQTERTVPRWDAPRTRARIDRLTRIASEAAAQCERSDLPIVHGPRSCEAWLQELPRTAHGVLFGPQAKGRLRLDGTPEELWCAVGPEGGFSDVELASFQTAGFTLASLGRLVLRVETAVAAALTIVQDRLEAGLQAR